MKSRRKTANHGITRVVPGPERAKERSARYIQARKDAWKTSMRQSRRSLPSSGRIDDESIRPMEEIREDQEKVDPREFPWLRHNLAFLALDPELYEIDYDLHGKEST